MMNAPEWWKSRWWISRDECAGDESAGDEVSGNQSCKPTLGEQGHIRSVSDSKVCLLKYTNDSGFRRTHCAEEKTSFFIFAHSFYFPHEYIFTVEQEQVRVRGDLCANVRI